MRLTNSAKDILLARLLSLVEPQTNSNVVDMSRFARALLDGGVLQNVRIIGEQTLTMMWSPAWSDPEDPSRQAALGWNVWLTMLLGAALIVVAFLVVSRRVALKD